MKKILFSSSLAVAFALTAFNINIASANEFVNPDLGGGFRTCKSRINCTYANDLNYGTLGGFDGNSAICCGVASTQAGKKKN